MEKTRDFLATKEFLTDEIKKVIRDAKAAIMAEMGIDNCIIKLRSLPVQIKQQETALADARRGLDEARGSLDLAKQIVIAMVAEERDINGKVMYSNAEARNAEVIRRLAVDDDFLAAKEAFKAAEDGVNQAQFELSRLQNDFGATKIVAQLLAARLNLLAGL